MLKTLIWDCGKSCFSFLFRLIPCILFAKCYRSVSEQAQPKPDLSFSPSSHTKKKTANSPPFLKFFIFLAKESQEWPWATYYINHVDNMKNDGLLLIGKRGEEKARGMNSGVASTWEASGEYSHSRLSSTEPCFDHFHCTFLLQESENTQCGLCILRVRDRLKTGCVWRERWSEEMLWSLRGWLHLLLSMHRSGPLPLFSL